MSALEPHSASVRITHWVNAVAFVALLVSGVAILLAHPRLYWGETGAIGTPSLIDLPLPMLLTGQSGWGRYLHFLAAWVCVITGATYLRAGLPSGHFRYRGYDPAQRLAYFTVVIVLVPAMIWTGLAMSPAMTAAAPFLVNVLGGQQSARTIHFFVASALVLFLAGHVVMVALSGFRVRMRGMITGQRAVTGGRA